MEHTRTVAVLGATGYIGGRLVAALLERGWKVRAVGRSAEKLRCRPFAADPNVGLAQADALDQGALTEALRGCHAAYYLVHSMYPGVKNFEDRDKRAAAIMRDSAREAGLERIIYLGGLGDTDKDLSEHLKSRMEVGQILRDGPVPLTWLRAAMIIGSGSASFEILRYLVDRLPLMITPAWVKSLCQPIAVTNVLEYLVGCLEQPATSGLILDIGGPDILSYRDLFDIYARVAGLRPRIIIPVPVLTPKLSSYWIQMVTPVPSSLSRPLAEGLRNKVVCRENSIRELVPTRLLSCEEAIARALDRTVRHEVQTCWSDAGVQRVPEWIDCGDAPYAGGTVLESAHTLTLAATPSQVWNVIVRLGGDEGWLYGNWMWKIRGLADKLIGGPGLRRGRRDPDELRVGDALDFWRVLIVEENRRLRLLAEMKLPGEALLQFDVEEERPGRTRLTLRARFLPRGLWGLAYWYPLIPVHGPLFRGMLTALARKIGGKILFGPVTPPKESSQCRL
ncbi:MAG: SDR family oxidoreductase [Desulfomicrobium sp.]|nr:SDR family oxidoreductase [Desulfomicrobium sp.]